MNSFLFFWISGGLALTNWFAVTHNTKWLEYVSKPGVIITLMIWLWRNSHFEGQLLWFGVGLAFSAAGDVFLMWPKRQFMYGLLSFLVAHLAYLVGLRPNILTHPLLTLIIGAIILIIVVIFYRRIYTAYFSGKKEQREAPIVALYALVIGLMLAASLNTWPGTMWEPASAALISGGATLFFLSDALIAEDTFVRPIPHRDLKVMVTYHLGQMGIIAGAVLQLA